MKELKIIVFLMIPCWCFGQSPAKAEKSMANYSEAPAPAAAADMANTFTAKSVDEPQVGAFQKRGIQKLKDFYNYLAIISNPKYDKALREDAKNQAKQLFYGSNCVVDGKIAMNFIDSCYNLTTSVDWKAVNIVISQNMSAGTSVNDSVEYHGEVSFQESKGGIVSGMKRAEMILSKSEKQFGGAKREVWSIYICSIE